MYVSMLFLVGMGAMLGGWLSSNIGRFLGQKGGAVLLAVTSATLSAVIFYIAFDTELSPHVSVGSLSWFTVEAMDIIWEFYVDSFTLVMLSAVTLVCTFVMLYSAWYMVDDPSVLRFMSLVFLFVGFMAWLVLSKSLALLFLGWEGIGVASFLLISFWSTRTLASQASMQSFLLNRVGDMLLMLGLVMFLTSSGSWSLGLLPEMAPFGEELNTGVGLCLILGGAMGKSAQAGLHAWLPNAMEAPTPVSALIHAATLVTAGVYLLARFGVSLLESEVALYVSLVGAVSLTFAGLIGLSQTDFKRVIAFSTMSQVGYMVMGCGVGAFQASIFMLYTHAFYKSLLFLGAGAVIHATANIQDTRSMGGEGIYLPVTKVLFLAASLALGASPFTSGDFSKDVLIELVSSSQFSSKNIFWMVAVGGTALTATYSGRLLRLVFAAEMRGSLPTPQHDLPFLVATALCLLASFSVAGGFLIAGVFELGLLFSLADTPGTSTIMAVEYQVLSHIMLIPLLCGGMGLLAGAGNPGTTCILPSRRTCAYSSVVVASRTLGGWDNTAPAYFIKSTLNLTKLMRKYQDAGMFELAGPAGLSSTILMVKTDVFIATHWRIQVALAILFLVILLILTG